MTKASEATHEPSCGALWNDDPRDHTHQCARPDTECLADEDDGCRCDCGAEVVWGDASTR
jgi:hypothetical protein